MSLRDDEPEHYRGKAPIGIELTDEGKEVFEGSAAKRTVLYSGGPVFVEGEPVEDTDVKVLARYSGNTLNTMNPAPVKPMAGKGAIAGGRVGKGKVFLSCPHPERQETTFDLVLSGIKFLTGVAPTPRYREKTRGAMVVRYMISDKASAQANFGDSSLRSSGDTSSPISHLSSPFTLHPFPFTLYPLLIISKEFCSKYDIYLLDFL